MDSDDHIEVDAFLHRIMASIDADPRCSRIPRRQRSAAGPPLLDLPLIKTAEELVAEAGSLPPMLVDSLLPQNSLFLLTGKPKAGKSFLALDIAYSVCRGAPALGELSVNTPGPALYLALEDGPIELARRLTQRGFTSTTPPAAGPESSSGLHFITDAFSLTDPAYFARFTRQARSLNPALIVIDTAAEALDIRDWINRAEILAKIAPLRRFARDLCTVLLVAHNRKAEGDMGDEIAGSNALAGAVDGWISAHRVERRENGNRRLFLRVEGRGSVGHELVTEMDHQTLTFSLIPPEQREADAALTRREAALARRAERHEQVRTTLNRLGGRATISEIAAAMGMQYQTAWHLVRELTSLGETEETQTTDRDHTTDGAGRPSPVYRLKSTKC